MSESWMTRASARGMTSTGVVSRAWIMQDTKYLSWFNPWNLWFPLFSLRGSLCYTWLSSLPLYQPISQFRFLQSLPTSTSTSFLSFPLWVLHLIHYKESLHPFNLWLIRILHSLLHSFRCTTFSHSLPPIEYKSKRLTILLVVSFIHYTHSVMVIPSFIPPLHLPQDVPSFSHSTTQDTRIFENYNIQLPSTLVIPSVTSVITSICYHSLRISSFSHYYGT